MTPFIVAVVLALIVSAAQKALVATFDAPSRFGNPNVGVWLFTEAALVVLLLVLIGAVCAIGTWSGLYFLGGWMLVRTFGFLSGLLSLRG